MSKLNVFFATSALFFVSCAWGQINTPELTSDERAPKFLNLRASSERVHTAKQFTGDLRDIVKTPNAQREIPERRQGYQKRLFDMAAPGNWATPDVPIVRAPAPAPLMNFIGLDRTGFGSGSPPDTVGDVGPVYYIQSVNSSLGIYRKSDGVRVVGLTLDNFMSQGAFGNLCDTDNFGDPVVLYDTFEDRWIITDFAFQLDAGGNVIAPGMLQCFAVSRSGDPVGGGWNFYSFNTTGGLGDYGKFAIWPDGLYMTFNMFDYAASGGYQNARVYAFDKMKMYAGDPNPGLVRVDLPSNEFTVLPSHARLQTGTPPAGTPNYYVSNASFFNSMQVYKFSVNWTNVSLSSFTGPSNATIPTYADPPATVPVLSGNNNDTLGSRLMMQNQYVNLGGTESLWNSFTVQGSSATQAAVRWVQLNITGGTLAATAPQAATHNPDTLNRYIPSIGLDRAGNMAVGYSTSSTTERSAIRYAGRFAGDPVNTLPQTEQTLILSTGSQTGGTLERWGDYAAMSLDPDDGCTFWFTSEYFIANGTNWQTRIGSFRYPTANCTSVVAGNLSGTVTAQTGGAPIAGAIVRLGARSTVTNAAGVYSFTGLAAGTYPQIAASASGFVGASANSLQINSGASVVQNFALANTATGLQCLTDTTQANFGTGTGSNIALTVGGDVQLSSSSAINQQSTLASTNGVATTTTQWIAQTFTPSASGALTRIDVNLFCSGCTGTAPSYTVRIRTANASGPTGADLATTTVAGNTSGASSAFTALFASPPTVIAGNSYAFIVNANPVPAPGTAAVLAATNDTTYTAGQSFASTNSGGSWITYTLGTPTATRRDLVFAVYLQTGFAASGDLVSANKFANSPSGQLADWTLQYTGSAPTNTTLRFQVAGSNSAMGPFNFVGPDNTASTFFTSGSTTALSNLRGYTYLRYRALLASTVSTVTPTLNDVTLCYQNTEVSTTDAGLQVGRVTLNAAVNGTNRVSTVRFARPFALPPVVIVQPSNDNTDPATLRIANVRADGFDVLQVEAPGCTGCTGLAGATSIDWLAAAPGSYRLTQDALRIGQDASRGGAPGPLVKVGTVQTRKHQRGSGVFASWLPSDWEAVSFPVDVPGRTFSSAPVVLSTLQSWNNEGPNLLGPVLSVRNSSSNWETTVVRNVNTTGFELAVEVSEVDDDDAGIAGLDANEIIGYVAIESGISINLLSTASTPIALATGTVTANDTCGATVLNSLSFPSAPTLANLRGFASKQSRTDADGGWVRRCAMTTPGGNAVSMTLDIDEDQDIDAERDHPTNESIGAAIFGGDLITSPVTLAFISLEKRGALLALEFSAATEVGHLGYRLWSRSDQQAPWTLASGLIPAQGGDSMKMRRYQAELEGSSSTQVRVEDVDLLGRSRFHDAISVGEQRGATPVEPAINWSAIRAANTQALPRRRVSGDPKAIAFVGTDGPQRVSFETLAAMGWPIGIDSSAIALSDDGVAVARAVVCEKTSASFGSGCAIEFLGKASTSLYGAENAYLISVNPGLARPVYAGAVISNQAQPGANVALFVDTLEQAPNRAYSFSAPGSDPWYDERMVATTSASVLTREFSLPQYHSGAAQLRVRLWGGLNYAAEAPDHHVQILLNGILIGEQRFDGLSLNELKYQISPAQLQSVNQLQIRLPAGTGYAADVVLLDGFSVEYLRNASAQNGALAFGEFGPGNDTVLRADFESTGTDINGISGTSVLWSERKGQIRRDRITQNVRVALDTEALWLQPENQVARPRVLAATPPASTTLGRDYLVITAPELQQELEPLLALQSARGLSTAVLRTDEIYARYSDHERSPQAIAQAIAAHQPRFVLLVGGDSYDYHDYLGLGSQSLLPTFYRSADAIVRFSASDAPFADLDGDAAPDLALGRLPARTADELRRAISSIVLRASLPPNTFFASAGKSSANEQFGKHSRAMLSYLRQGQATNFALVDEIGIADAVERTRSALQQSDWVNFLGHSSPNRWALENLMNTSQLAGLNRTGAPGIVSQWGCWNSYFVLPNQDSMSHVLLFGSNGLAAAVIGSSSLAEDASHMALATRFFDLVEDGQFDEQGGSINTLGEALQYAKRNLSQFAPEHIESNYSITLFGDPAQPLR